MPETASTRLLADRYRLVERLGAGGMATVHLADDERLGRQVAIKRLHAHSPDDTAKRFAREARLGASLNHPNLVTIYDTVTDGEAVLIVMEYVKGETLSACLKRDGALDPARVADIVCQIGAALDHAHEHGIVHRDIKPANILLGPNGVAKLVDLGIAVAVEGTRITRADSVVGTAAYMAPELLDGREAGPAADVYALAVVAYEALSGQRAYRGTTPLEIAHQVVDGPPPDLGEAMPDAPPEARDVLRRAMSTAPELRPSSASELANDLARAFKTPVRREREVPTRHLPSAAASAEPAQPRLRPERAAAAPAPAPAPVPPARPPRAPEPRGGPSRRGALAIAAVIALLLVAGAAAFMLFGGDDGGGSSGGSGDELSAAEKKAQDERKTARRKARREREQQAAAAPQQQPQDQAPTEESTPAEQPSDPGGNYSVPRPTGDDPGRGAELHQQAYQLVQDGKFEEAIPIAEESVRQFPEGTDDMTYAYSLFNLGTALRQAGRPDDAIPVLEERLKIDNQRDIVQRELDLAREEAGGG